MFRTDKLLSPPNNALASSQVKPTRSTTTTPRRGAVNRITTYKLRQKTLQTILSVHVKLTCQSHDSPSHRPVDKTNKRLASDTLREFNICNRVQL